MSEIPQGWLSVRLIEFADVIMGQSPPSESYNQESIGLSFFQGKAEFTGLYPVVQKWCNAPNKIAEPNDILLSVRAPVGATNISNVTCCIGRGLSAIRYVNCYRFPFYYFRLICKQLEEKGTGTTFRAISGDVIKSTQIPFPPLPEQHRIVAKIEELFSSLDKGIESLKTAQAQLKTYRQAVLKWAFEGKLTNENVKEGELPEGWKWVKISDFLFHPKKGMMTGPFGTALKKNEHKESGVPVLGIENIGEGTFQLPNKIFVSQDKAAELNSFKVSADDIIISRSGTIGEICCVPETFENALISTNLVRVRLNQNVISSKYFVYLFQGGAVREQVKELCKGSTRAFLNQTILNSLSFPYCSPKEQTHIVSEIESRLSVCDKLEETITQSLAQADALRQSILKKAFEGKLVPQDPNDEPAGVLLERIRAERASATTKKKESSNGSHYRPTIRAERDDCLRKPRI